MDTRRFAGMHKEAICSISVADPSRARTRFVHELHVQRLPDGISCAEFLKFMLLLLLYSLYRLELVPLRTIPICLPDPIADV